MAMKVFRMESNKKRYCLSVQLSGKTMNYLTILFITVFIAFTLYVQFSRYVFMHNIAKENLLEIYAFHAACTCYGEFVMLLTYYVEYFPKKNVTIKKYSKFRPKCF